MRGKLIKFLFVFTTLLYDCFGQVPTFTTNENYGIEAVVDIANFYGNGASAADYDQDGDIDFFLATTSGVTDRIYRNQGDGTFKNVATESGIILTTGSRMAIWFDYDNDHLLDLVVLGERCATFACGQPILINLYRQLNDGTFEEATAGSGIAFGDKYEGLQTYAAGGMAAGDFNADGHLDLIVTIWGGRASLFENNRDGTFTDVSESSCVGVKEAFFWQPAFLDFDNDGHLDIFMNVDFDRNQLWLNRGDGTFIESAAQVGLASDFSEMGLSINDYDNDGDFDIYATNITRTFQGENEHNVLLRNDSESGFLVFNDVAVASQVGNSGWDWGTTFFDANNDGWLDLATTNGWNNDPNWGSDQSHFWQSSNGNFSDQSSASGFNDILSATTLIAFDADRDGDLDLLQTLKDNPDTKLPAILYENQIETQNNYLVIRPRMQNENHWAIGAIVEIDEPGFFNMRLISAGTSFYGQEPAEAFFGLGNRTFIEEVKVRWPVGNISYHENIDANQVLTLENEIIPKPSNLSAVLDGEGVLLTWNDNADNETGIRVQKSPSSSFEEVIEFEINAENNSYLDDYLVTHSFYRIRGYNEKASSAFSNTVKIGSTITSVMESNVQTFKVYPNPTYGRVNIELGKDYYYPINTRLYDLSGNLVWQETFYNKRIIADLSSASLKSGIYLLQIRTGDHQFSKKLIIRD